MPFPLHRFCHPLPRAKHGFHRGVERIALIESVDKNEPIETLGREFPVLRGVGRGWPDPEQNVSRLFEPY